MGYIGELDLRNETPETSSKLRIIVLHCYLSKIGLLRCTAGMIVS